MDQDQFVVTVSCLAVATLVLVVLLVRQWRKSRRLRRRNEILVADLGMYDEELRHLAAVRLPELMDHRPGGSATLSGPLYERELAQTGAHHSLHRVMELFAETVQQSQSRADRSAKATLRAMMRTVQSLANEQQLDITSMQNRHDDPDVLEDLLKIDHMNAQIGRRAQATAVLCGSWPGQQRSASSLSDVARGATSRVRDYLRVKIPAPVNVAVIGRAVEPVVLALAELLDNATRHSAPDTSVEVNFHTVHNGVAITIDDAGVAMDAEELAQAGRSLSGERQVQVDRLGDPPQIGFAVIGVLARRYGFSVSVDTRSPYGGVRAVLFLPTPLLTRTAHPPETTVTVPAARAAGTVTPPTPLTPQTAPVRATAPVGAAASAAPAGATPLTPLTAPTPAGAAEANGSAGPAGSTAGGLPKRRRLAATGEGVADWPPAGPSLMGSPPPGPQPSDGPGRHARRTAAGMGAWQRGTRSGRAVAEVDKGEGTG